ncbi:hypothetical protein [Actinomyces sp. MRS3W]|nr:hypothetical protein [Actinomyces sp. MRS3W]MDU0347823.1 hypothetical protein [Actinomyces sp. MRS3W]
MSRSTGFFAFPRRGRRARPGWVIFGAGWFTVPAELAELAVLVI